MSLADRLYNLTQRDAGTLRLEPGVRSSVITLAAAGNATAVVHLGIPADRLLVLQLAELFVEGNDLLSQVRFNLVLREGGVRVPIIEAVEPGVVSDVTVSRSWNELLVDGRIFDAVGWTVTRAAVVSATDGLASIMGYYVPIGSLITRLDLRPAELSG